MVTSVSLVTGKSSIQIYTDLYRSMFHLNWPVMETDLWSLHSISLFAYLLICFNYIKFIETLR